MQAVEVIAQNRTDFDVRVYVLHKGHMVPLEGLVPGGGNATLSLPSALEVSEEPIQLVADLIGSNDWHRSEPMTLTGRDEIKFMIEGSTVVRTTRRKRGEGPRGASRRGSLDVRTAAGHVPKLTEGRGSRRPICA
jgi:hypothetical protein